MATALFIGGIVAGGFAFRPDPVSSSGSATTPPEVIHKRKVKTVHVPSGSSATGLSADTPAGTPVATPVSAPAPLPVSSRTSPGGSAGGGGDGDDREVDGGESD